MFKRTLTVERAIAGTAHVAYPDLARPPARFREKNLYFDTDVVPDFDFALKVWGQSAEMVGINNDDVVLCQEPDSFLPKEGYVVIVPASKCYTETDVHEDWKCIRTVTKVLPKGLVEVRAGQGDTVKIEKIPADAIIGHAVYKFRPEVAH